MKSKRGLSAIVATLLIILLTLVAVGIIWVVIRNVVQTGGTQAEFSAKCISVNLEVSAAACNATTTCNITYTRKSGGEDIDGLYLIVSDGQMSNQTEVTGNIIPGSTRTAFHFLTGLTSPTTAEVAAYFIDDSGTEQRCDPTGTFNIL